jgi:hypothetical protein
MNSRVKYFTIYGERCSGTNFLESAIINNFKIEVTWNYGWKHFFGNYDFSNRNKEIDETLFIGIIRDPISWLDSLYKEPHHIPYHNRLSLNTFLLNEHYSTIDNYSSIEEYADRHIITKERYKNIFELRKVKNNYLIYFMPTYVKNYIFIRYEDLKNNYEFILSHIQEKFNLIRYDENIPFLKIIKYKGSPEQADYKEKNISFSKEIINKIKENLDIEQENILGYL